MEKTFFFIFRINRMAPETSENLKCFLEVYRRSGRYFLAPAIVCAGDGLAELVTENMIGKYDLEVRDAWQIGMNDPDMVALDTDDPPVIPAPVVNAPVLGALEWLRSKKRGSE